MMNRKRARKKISTFFTRRKGTSEIAPDEIFLDASNLPLLDPEQFEGRVEHPVSRIAIVLLGVVFVLAGAVFSWRAFDLQVSQGALFAAASQNNRLSHSLVFASRGIIYDRYGRELAWNEICATDCVEGREPGETFALRRYYEDPGLAHLLGYVRYPRQDDAGQWWREEMIGVTGIEKVFDATLQGQNGKKIVEVDALGAIQREQIIEPARNGKNVTLSIDAIMQSRLHQALTTHAANQGFEGGASVIMNARTGEVLAMVSTPEFDPQALTNGDAEALQQYNRDPNKPFLNRAIAGLYTPGSIVKPIFAAAALVEGIITPEKEIHSPGFITIPNPFDPSNPTIMRDWRAHGWTDMREAIAVSSDVYFYAIGGGYEDQRGLGIERIESYAHAFGLAKPTGIDLPGEASGVIPTPEWKAEVFNGDPWRLGDTYNTSIGQYGFQITAIQAARYAAALANGGQLVTPHLVRHEVSDRSFIGIGDNILEVVREGMRMGVTASIGTVQSLNIPAIAIAAKSGTAEVGSQKQWINSWVIGFWPADDPQYVFATVLERAPSGTLSGAAPAMRPFFEWLATYKPQSTPPSTE